MSIHLITIKAETEKDIQRLRFTAMAVTKALDLGTFAQTRAVTALLEAARNAQQHAENGRVRLSLTHENGRVALRAIVTDQGSGIESGAAPSPTDRLVVPGLGLGLKGLGRLADQHVINTGSEGTEVDMLFMSHTRADELAGVAARVTDAIASIRKSDPLAELEEQNRVLIEALNERDLMMREVHHRTGNNLALIGALIRMSRKDAELEETKSVLGDLEQRVQSIIKAHEQLQKSARVDRLQARPFLEDIARNAEAAFSSDALKVDVCVAGEDPEISASMAIDLGLLVGELLTNAFKHAFVGRSEGVVRVHIQEEADEIRLTVKDNGRGLRQEDERPERSGSLGWRMIRSTVGKYAGTLEVDGSDGLSVAFRLPLADS